MQTFCPYTLQEIFKTTGELRLLLSFNLICSSLHQFNSMSPFYAPSILKMEETISSKTLVHLYQTSLQYAGTYLQYCMTSHPRRQQLS